RRCAADSGGRAARARPRRRRLGLAQPARVQRDQDLRPRRTEAERCRRRRDRGAARRRGPGRGEDRPRRRRHRQLSGAHCRAVRQRSLGPARRGRLRQRGLLDDRPEGIRAARRAGDGDRYVLEALRREGGLLGGEQSGHIIYLKDHVTGDGLAAAMLLCAALEGRTLAEAATVLPRYPQAKENVRVATKHLSEDLFAEIERVNEELDGSGRILVRASGTEPVVRVLAEAEN